jgi:hypothetical protein
LTPLVVAAASAGGYDNMMVADEAVGSRPSRRLDAAEAGEDIVRVTESGDADTITVLVLCPTDKQPNEFTVSKSKD